MQNRPMKLTLRYTLYMYIIADLSTCVFVAFCEYGVSALRVRSLRPASAESRARECALSGRHTTGLCFTPPALEFVYMPRQITKQTCRDVFFTFYIWWHYDIGRDGFRGRIHIYGLQNVNKNHRITYITTGWFSLTSIKKSAFYLRNK